MSDKEFRVFLDLLMVSDPWPLTAEKDKGSQQVMEAVATREASKRGYKTWIEAYHGFLLTAHDAATGGS